MFLHCWCINTKRHQGYGQLYYAMNRAQWHEVYPVRVYAILLCANAQFVCNGYKSLLK